MWRPKGWDAHIALLDNANLFVNPNRTDKDAQYLIRAVEAGADAILQALYEYADGYPICLMKHPSEGIQVYTREGGN